MLALLSPICPNASKNVGHFKMAIKGLLPYYNWFVTIILLEMLDMAQVGIGGNFEGSVTGVTPYRHRQVIFSEIAQKLLGPISAKKGRCLT